MVVIRMEERIANITCVRVFFEERRHNILVLCLGETAPGPHGHVNLSAVALGDSNRPEAAMSLDLFHSTVSVSNRTGAKSEKAA